MSAARFIVTGGAGFIGSNLVAALNRRGERDILLVDHLNHPAKEANLRRLDVREVLDRTEFRKRLHDDRLPPVDTVFHLGACSSTTETDAAYLEDNNLAYTRDLCTWSLAKGARFIYASSAATYGDGSLGYADDHALTPRFQPLNLYGDSKQRFDLWALKQGHLDQVVGLKYFNVFGPGEEHKGDMRSVVHKAYGQIRDTGELRLFKSANPQYADGCQDRDFIYVADTVAVTLFFHDHPEAAGLFNCGTGQARTWLDLAHAIFAAMGREPRISMIEMPLALRDKYQYHTQADISKLRGAGYKAPFTSIEDGVRDYVQNHLATAKGES